MTLVRGAGAQKRRLSLLGAGAGGLSQDPLMLAVGPSPPQNSAASCMVPQSHSQGAGSQADWIPVELFPQPQMPPWSGMPPALS